MDPNRLLELINNNPVLANVLFSGMGTVFRDVLARLRLRQKEGENSTMQPESQLPSSSEAVAQLVPLLKAQGMSVQGTFSPSAGLELQFHEKRQIGNVVDAVGHAAEDLQGKEIPDQEPDHGWNSRFFGNVQNVSSVELKELYGKVLSGQIQRPGSVSLLSLNVLKDMDAAAAKHFQTLCSACVFLTIGGEIPKSMVPSPNGDAGQNALREHGLSFDVLNLLHAHGLIIPDYNSWLPIQPFGVDTDPEEQRVVFDAFRFQGRLWNWEADNDRVPATELKIHGVALTRAGVELSAAVDVLPMGPFTKELQRFFKSHNLRMVEVTDPGNDFGTT